MSAISQEWELTEVAKGVQLFVSDSALRRGGTPERIRVERDIALRGLVVTLEKAFFGEVVEDQHIEFPSTWWDAVKQRWFPQWLQRKFRVRMTIYEFSVANIATRLTLPADVDPLITVRKYSNREEMHPPATRRLTRPPAPADHANPVDSAGQ